MELNQNSSNRGMLKVIVFVLAFVVFLAGAFSFYKKTVTPKVEMSEYQAVFLANNQVYFGKLELGHKWVILKNIYYLQRQSSDLQPASGEGASNSQSQIQLVKLGQELHGPEDEMYIPTDKILFWENLKDDSRVVQLMKQN